MPPVPGSGDSFKGGVQDMDDGRGPFVPGAEEGKVPVQVVRGRYGDWFAGGAHGEKTSGGGIWETELGKHAHW